MLKRLAGLVLGAAVLLAVVGVASPADANPYYRTSIGATAGKGSCTVNWIRDYWDGPVSGYTVWVVPQKGNPSTSPNYRKVPVAPPVAGASKSVRIPGLTAKTAYVFWLVATYPSYFRTGPISLQVGTSRVCVPT